MVEDGRQKEILIQNNLNCGLVDTILNKKRAYVLGIFPILYLITHNPIMSASLFIASIAAIYKMMPVTIQEKNQRIDYLAIIYLNKYVKKIVYNIEDYLERFLRW